MMRKNYYRDELYEIGEIVGYHPIVISGKFEFNHNTIDYLTFSDIKPMMENTPKDNICDHVNVKIQDLERCFNIYNLVPNQKYFLIVQVVEYQTNNDFRAGVKIADIFDDKPPIFTESELHKYSNELLDYVYPLDEFYAS